MKPISIVILAVVAIFVISVDADAEPDQIAQSLFTKLMEATVSNDYEAFVDVCDAGMKAALTRQMLEGVSQQLKPRTDKGYVTTYLGEMQKQGYQVHLWRLRFKGGGDDALATLSVKDSKVGGFFIQ